MARSFWPGQSSRTNVTSDTGAVDVWQEAAKLSANIGDVATKLYLRDGQDQLSTSEIQIKAEEAKLAAALQGEQDQNKYDAILDEHRAAVGKLRPQHPLAGDAFDDIVANKSITWGTATEDAKNNRLSDKHETKIITTRNQGIESGDLALYERQEMAGVALYGWDESKATERIEAARHLADRRKMESVAGNDPEWILDNMKTPADMKRLFPDSDPADFAYIRGLTKGSIADKKIERGRITLDQTATIKRSATDPNVTTEFMSRKIQQSDGLTPEQKITAMNLFTQSRQTMAKGGSNAYTTTDNWTLYSEHRERAAKRTITEQEIMDSVGPRGYSWPQAEKLISIINGKDSSAKAFEDSGAAKNLTAQIDALIPTGRDADRTEVALNQFATQKGLGLLEDAIARNPDWTDREKKEEALRIGRQLEREDDEGTLELGLERALEMTTEEQAQEIERDLNKIDLTKIKKINRGIPQPKTKAEYDAIPVGATYIHPELGRVTKR